MSTIQQTSADVNLLRAILWQYNKSVNLQGIIEKKQAWNVEARTKFWSNWYRDVFDLRTANEFGLKVWSIILDLPLFFNSDPSPDTKPTWGFGAYRFNFRGANFSNRDGATVQLPTEGKRIALQLRYMQLTGSGSVPETNRRLAAIFGQYGGAYLLDGHDMTQEYYFKFKLPWFMQYAFDELDVLPRPAGVKSTYRDSSQTYWGFGEYRLNFRRGNFGRK